MKTRMQRAAPVSLAVTLALAPMAGYVRADDRTQIAAAIGAEEGRPAAAAKPPSTTAPAKSTNPSTVAASTTPAATDASTDSGLSQAQIWLGVGVAAFLAAVGGGGGGGGGSAPNSP